MTVDRPHVTAVFVEAAASFADLVAEAVTSPLERPALGEWTLRDLVGHASRAFTTVVDYLTDSPPADMSPALAPDGTDLSTDDDPVGACGAYFLATTGRPELSRDVAERGRQAGRSLGGDPAGAVAELAGADAGSSSRRRQVRSSPPGSDASGTGPTSCHGSPRSSSTASTSPPPSPSTGGRRHGPNDWCSPSWPSRPDGRATGRWSSAGSAGVRRSHRS